MMGIYYLHFVCTLTPPRSMFNYPCNCVSQRCPLVFKIQIMINLGKNGGTNR